MKILFWLLAIILVPVNVYLTFFFLLSGAVGGYSGTLGVILDILGIMGHATIIISIVGLIVAIIFYKKGQLKKAFLCVIAGTIYGLALVGSMLLLDVIHNEKYNADYENKLVEIFGENWDAPSNYSEIPDGYERVLNMMYVAVKEQWTQEEFGKTGELWGVETMIPYYGDNSLENIGFIVKDLNNDGIDELVIGTTNEETLVFIIYYDPGNTSELFSGAEGRTYYVHNGENGLYQFEIDGVNDEGNPMNASWSLVQGTADNLMDFNYVEGALDPMNRLTLEMIPFADYK